MQQSEIVRIKCLDVGIDPVCPICQLNLEPCRADLLCRGIQMGIVANNDPFSIILDTKHPISASVMPILKHLITKFYPEYIERLEKMMLLV